MSIITYNFEDIARDVGSSLRQIERDFKGFIGMSPRDYHRIIRFYKALNNIEKKSLAEVAIEAGYYDQAHMIRDFKKLSVWTPDQLKKSRIRFLNNE